MASIAQDDETYLDLAVNLAERQGGIPANRRVRIIEGPVPGDSCWQVDSSTFIVSPGFHSRHEEFIPWLAGVRSVPD